MNVLWIVAALSLAQAPQRVCYNGVEFVANNVIRLDDGKFAIEWDAENTKAYREALAAKGIAKPQPAPNVPAPVKGGHEQQRPDSGQTPSIPTDYGVDPSKLRPKGFSATDQASKAFAEKVERRSTEDPNSNLHLSFIGSEQQCRAPMDDMEKNPNLRPLKDYLAIQEYRPDNWAVNPNLGFRPGTPAVYLQDSKGKVLYRTTSYEGPDRLAEAIRIERRKADPKYDPDADPGSPSRAATCPLGFTREMWPAIIATSLICAAIWLKRSKE